MTSLRDAALSIKGTKIFEVLDDWLPPSLLENPHAPLAELRKKYGPVIERSGPESNFDGFDVASMFLLDKTKPYFLVLNFDAVAQVYRSSDIYNQGYGNTFEQLFGKTLSTMNPPDQRPMKVFMQRVFSRDQVDSWTREIVEPILDELVTQMMAEGQRADIVQEVLASLPFMMICRIIGIDLSLFRELAFVSRDLFRLKEWDVAMGASAYLADMFREMINDRRRAPREDLVTRLVNAELGDGQKLADDEIINFLRNLFPAGMDTTHRIMASMTLALLRDRSLLEQLKADRSKIPAAVEESIRWEGPSVFTPRVTTQDTELEGIKIPAGSSVIVSQSCANRDPSRWQSPDVFDPFRPQLPHVAFGGGAHVCLGNGLARREAALWVNTILDRLPDMTVDPEQNIDDLKILGLTLRSPPSIPVIY